MVKIRIEGTTYFYDPKSLYMYKEKVFGGIYYVPLDYCDIRIKDFIKEKPHTIYTHPEENAGILDKISGFLDKMLSLF